jgi:hypothetical protein
MSGRCPFKKVKLDPGASSRKKAKSMYEHNMLVGMRDVHLPNGWLLNAWRVSVPFVPRHGKERLD